MRCAIYLRISDDRSGLEAGVDRQREACEALAKRLGWEVVQTFVDNDISAYSGKRRPGFENMLAAVETKKVDALVCWHTDRLYRALKDLVRLLEASNTLEIRTVEGGDIDLSTANGRMVATILGGVSTNESEHHAERRRAANLARALSGSWRREGSRPFGYTNFGVPLEPEASMLRIAAKEVLGGKSLHAVAREWNDSGVTTVRAVPWTNLHVRRVLTNARIAALRVHQGKVVGPGNWEPILQEQTFHGLVAFLSDPSRKNAVAFERRYLLSGIAKCGYRTPDADLNDPDSICGRRLYATYPHGKNRPMVYSCKPVQHLGRSGPQVDKFVTGLVVSHLAEQGLGAGLRAEDRVDTIDLSTRRDSLAATKGNLATLLRKGILDMDAVVRESAILTNEIADIDKQLADANVISPVAMMLAEDDEDLGEIVADVDNLLERWFKASPDIQGKIINFFFDVVILPARRGLREFDPDLIEIRWK